MWRTKEKERPLRCRLHVMRFANSSVTRRQHTQEETERAAWTSTQHGFRSFHILPIRCFPLQQASTTRCPTEATSPVLGVAVADGVVAASRSYLSESDGQMNSDAVVVSRRACPRKNHGTKTFAVELFRVKLFHAKIFGGVVFLWARVSRVLLWCGKQKRWVLLASDPNRDFQNCDIHDRLIYGDVSQHKSEAKNGE